MALLIKNGEIVTVSNVDEKGRIHLDDGRIVPTNFKQFAHGYAVTAHRSQGKSVDSVIISGDGMQKEIADRRIASGTEAKAVGAIRNQGRSHGRPDSCRAR